MYSEPDKTGDAPPSVEPETAQNTLAPCDSPADEVIECASADAARTMNIAPGTDAAVGNCICFAPEPELDTVYTPPTVIDVVRAVHAVTLSVYGEIPRFAVLGTTTAPFPTSSTTPSAPIVVFIDIVHSPCFNVKRTGISMRVASDYFTNVKSFILYRDRSVNIIAGPSLL